MSHAADRATQRLGMTLTPELEDKIVTAIRTRNRVVPIPARNRKYTSVYLYKPQSKRPGYFVVYAKQTKRIATVYPRAWFPEWVAS